MAPNCPAPPSKKIDGSVLSAWQSAWWARKSGYATTGQNGLQQAKVFGEVCRITGVVLTKLDGTAKGGIVIAVQRQLGVPVKLVGLGEGPDDLAPFEAEGFVDALLEG